MCVCAEASANLTDEHKHREGCNKALNKFTSKLHDILVMWTLRSGLGGVVYLHNIPFAHDLDSANRGSFPCRVCVLMGGECCTVSSIKCKVSVCVCVHEHNDMG